MKIDYGMKYSIPNRNSTDYSEWDDQILTVSLQSHYRMIEAHDLKKTTLTTPEDETVPDLERMTRKLGAKSQQFFSEVYEEGYHQQLPKTEDRWRGGKKETERGRRGAPCYI